MTSSATGLSSAMVRRMRTASGEAWGTGTARGTRASGAPPPGPEGGRVRDPNQPSSPRDEPLSADLLVGTSMLCLAYSQPVRTAEHPPGRGRSGHGPESTLPFVAPHPSTRFAHRNALPFPSN
ncbi:hypothetical protein GCM10010335_37830 [Streptomyces galbus]|nr:hypothetical protein GCM10010335_37830 [Streptomyces galbus]